VRVGAQAACAPALRGRFPHTSAPQTPGEAIKRQSPAGQCKNFSRLCSAMGVLLLAGFVGLSTSARILTSFVPGG
jgi:hypothetical protein